MASKSRSYELQPRSELAKRLGAAFRDRRESVNLSLRGLREETGISIWSIRCHEAGQRMLRTDDLYRAAKALRVRPTELLYIDKEGLNG